MCHNCEPFSPTSFLGFSDGVRMDGSFFVVVVAFCKNLPKSRDFFFYRSLATPGAEGQEAAAT